MYSSSCIYLLSEIKIYVVCVGDNIMKMSADNAYSLFINTCVDW